MSAGFIVFATMKILRKNVKGCNLKVTSWFDQLLESLYMAYIFVVERAFPCAHAYFTRIRLWIKNVPFDAYAIKKGLCGLASTLQMSTNT